MAKCNQLTTLPFKGLKVASTNNLAAKKHVQYVPMTVWRAPRNIYINALLWKSHFETSLTVDADSWQRVHVINHMSGACDSYTQSLLITAELSVCVTKLRLIKLLQMLLLLVIGAAVFCSIFR